MNKIFFSILLCFSYVAAKTIFLDNFAILDKSSRTYQVHSTIEIAPSDTLFIPKGVTIAFYPLCGIELKGTLQAIGTQLDVITFTSIVALTGQGQSYAWRGIQMYPTSTIELQYAMVAYSSTGISSCCDNISLDHVVFRQNGKWNVMIGNRVITVPENEPYTYHPVSLHPIDTLTITTVPNINKIMTKVYIPKRDYVITPLAIAAVIVGGIYINKFINSQSEYNDYKPSNNSYDNATSPQRKEHFGNLRKDIYLNGILGCTLAAFGVTGIGYVTIYTLNF